MRKYQFLTFQTGVNWRKVNPKLLQRLNRLGADKNVIITVVSGYRTYAEQAVLYQRYLAGGNIAAKPGQSNHEKGLAVDAYVNGTSIGKVYSSRTMSKYGLSNPVSGDYPHTELLGGGSPTSPTGPSQAPGDQNSAVPGPTPTNQPAQQPVLATPPVTPPQIVPPQIGYPGDSVPTDYQKLTPADTWQTLADMPFSSPETQMWARRLKGV